MLLFGALVVSGITAAHLVLGYMEGLQIEEVIPLDVNLADGLLAHPTYWHAAKPGQ